jgi:FtsP/CotA-like multicopper oxidase with cupredoxin domain
VFGLLLVAAVVIGVIAVDGGDDESSASSAHTSKASDPTADSPPAPVDPFKAGAPFTQPRAVRIDGATPTGIVARNTDLKVNGDGAQAVTVGEGQAYLAGNDQTARLTGPTLLARPGGTVNLTLKNELKVYKDMESPENCQFKSTDGQVTNFHFHGLRVTPETRKIDGVTVYGDNVLIDLPPGTSRIEFEIPADHEQGTFWYHAHRHGCTDDQVSRGLAGLLFIGDSREDLPQRFRNVRTRDLVLQDLQVVKDGNGYKVDPKHFWADPTNRMVNGLAQPTMQIAPGETELWRVVNASAGVWYEVSLVDDPDDEGVGFTTVAMDGNTLEDSREETSHLLGPGNRVDFLVTGPMSGAKRLLKTLAFQQGKDLKQPSNDFTFPEELLATVQVGGTPGTPIEEPGRLKPLKPLAKDRGPNREFTFDIGPPLKSRPGPPSFTINGQTFTHDSPAQATPTVGTTERWTIRNTSTEAHPFHIHQGDFRVLSVNGRRVNNGGQQDVVELPYMQADGKPGEVVFDMTFREEGDFVFHCHILDHEDFGMMARVSVTDGN